MEEVEGGPRRWSEGGGGRECGTMVVMATPYGFQHEQREQKRETEVCRWRKRSWIDREGSI